MNLPDVRKQKRLTIKGALGRARFDLDGMNYFRIATITQDSYHRMPIVDSMTWFPSWLSGSWNKLLYLLPSVFLAFVFRILAKYHPIFFGFYLSGTILHELAHFFAGALTNARPGHFSVFPRWTSGNHWVLGSVSFTNIRWYNAVFVGLAPVLILMVPILIAFGRAKLDRAYGWWDVGVAALVAPIFLSFWPSR